MVYFGYTKQIKSRKQHYTEAAIAVLYIELGNSISYEIACPRINDSDEPAQMHGLIRVIVSYSG